MTSREINIRQRNERIRSEIKALVEDGYQMKVAWGMVGEKYYISEATVRGVLYDKRRK
jgi:hypothetical protein